MVSVRFDVQEHGDGGKELSYNFIPAILVKVVVGLLPRVVEHRLAGEYSALADVAICRTDDDHADREARAGGDKRREQAYLEVEHKSLRNRCEKRREQTGTLSFAETKLLVANFLHLWIAGQVARAKDRGEHPADQLVCCGSWCCV